jgi:hypothetical protein
MKPWRHLSWPLVASLGLAAWGVCDPARAEEDCELGAFGCEHEQNHGQYKGWTDKDGTSCCNGQDCRPVRAQKNDEGYWEIYIPELKGMSQPPNLRRGWVRIPRSMVYAPDRFHDGRSHACTSRPGNPLMPVPIIYCFTPAQPKS